MKRADQHNVATNKLHQHDAGIEEQEQTGLDAPSEKEVGLTEHEEKPTMGALPVDIPGSLKHPDGWKSAVADESHEASVDAGKEKKDANGKIIATGAGPDPEHADNGI